MSTKFVLVMMPLPTVRVATAHIAPHLLNKRLSTQKTIEHIARAAKHDAQLVCFPESSIPGFPFWASVIPPASPATHDLFARFADASVVVGQEEVTAIQSAAKQHRVSVSVGISERASYSLGTLWNSNLLINQDGKIVCHHRKLACTWFEKLLWAPGDGYGLRTMNLASEGSEGDVKVGALICGENTNSLARYATMSLGEQIHLSTWPAVWPSRMSTGAEKSTGRNYDNVLANRIRAAAHCFEAKCFGIMCAGQVNTENTDTVISLIDESDPDSAKAAKATLEQAPRAASMILDPTGTPVESWTIGTDGQKASTELMQHDEGLLFADLDINECVEGKQYHDLLGGYQRLDVFNLQVNRERREPVTFAPEHVVIRSFGDEKQGLKSEPPTRP